ncbi:MAG: hypothetical protein QM496_07810 [Verrucomicrobiota bacterium]
MKTPMLPVHTPEDLAGGISEKQLKSIQRDRRYLTGDGFVLENKKKIPIS